MLILAGPAHHRAENRYRPGETLSFYGADQLAPPSRVDIAAAGAMRLWRIEGVGGQAEGYDVTSPVRATQ